MVSRRRTLGTAGTVLGSLLAGCLGARDDGRLPVPHVAFELRNRSEDAATIHAAVETASELVAWHSREVAAGETETVTAELAENERPVAVHGVAGAHTTRGSVMTDGFNDVEEVCPHVVLRYPGDYLEVYQHAGVIDC